MKSKIRNGTILTEADQRQFAEDVRKGRMLYPRFRADEISASTGKEHGKLWQYILSLESARMDGRRARGGSEVYGKAASQVRRGGSEWGRVGTGSAQSPSVAYSPKYRKLDSGTESEVFDTGDGWVVKVRQIHPLSIGDVIDELAKVVYHNYLFPGEKYVLDDIVRHEHDGYREFYLILRQPFVTPKTENGRIVQPTYAQIWQLMKSRPQGFTFMDLSSRPAETGEYGDYSSSDGDEGEVVPAVKKVAYNRQFVVYDFQPGRNTFIDAKSGKVRFIDPRIDINDPGAGFRYSKYGTRRVFDGDVDFDTPELGVGSTIVSGDEVRKTMPGYNRLDWSTHVDRTGYVGPKLEAQFQRLLKTRKGKGNGHVVFLAGGNGAGKSTVAAKLGGTPDFTIDSTLGNLEVAKKQIDAILANGQTPDIRFVYRTPGQALEGIAQRVKNGGHIVSPLSFANSHVKSRENLRLLSEAYGDRIHIHIYDNSVPGAPEITLEQLEAKGKPDHARIRENANYYLGQLRGRDIEDNKGGVAGGGAKGEGREAQGTGGQDSGGAKGARGQVDFDTSELGIREKQTALSGGTSRNQNPSGNEYGRKWKIFKPGTRNVDIGAGRFDKATKFLADIGVTNIPFDPVNRDSATNRRAAEDVRDNPADTATVHNVLNVIDNDAVMEGIVNQAARAIKKGGSAIFTIYEGNRSGVGARTRDGYQRNAKARSYEPTIKKFFGSVETHGNVILARRPKDIGPAFWAFDSSFENGINFDTPELSPEGRREHDSIVARYTNADGTKKPGWMKAPNGRPTNLTERQWVQVRTPAFRAWFGDWEGDPANASKVVDENGEPLVVYHGTETGGFSAFNGLKNSSSSFGLEGATFFSTSLETAKTYATSPKVGDISPFLADAKEWLAKHGAKTQARWLDSNEWRFVDTDKEIKPPKRGIRVEYQVVTANNTFVPNSVGATVAESMRKAERSVAIALMPGEGSMVYGCFIRARNPYVVDFKGNNWRGDAVSGTTLDVARKAREAGFDCAIVKNVDDSASFLSDDNISDSIAVFSPENIKSATGNSGDFSRTNPDIRFDSPELSAGAQYDPRSRIPNVRGGWTEGKILRYLKATPSLHGVRAASRLIAEFASPEELKEHMFYHGTKASVSGLSPSITKSEEWAERHGGGGYGTRYWGVSVSKSKRVASSFGGHSPGVSIYPVVLAKGAKVVDRADLADADDVSDHIVELWNDGVDAVRLGDWKEDFSEQELLILNPRAICNVGTPDYYRQFRLWSPENPLNIKDDAQIAEVYEAAREYAGYSPFARFGKPTPPKMFENGELKPKEVRDAERAQYEKELEAWRSSEQGRAAEAYESNARNVIRFDSPELAPEARAREIASFTQRYYSRQRGLQRLAKPSASDVMDAAEGRWAKFRRIVQDKNLVIREVEERLGVTDKRESVYYAKDREFGLNEYQLGELQKRRVDPILDRLAETGASQRDFDLYLIARHAPYRNAVLRERGVTDGAGMGDAEAAEVIEGFNRLGVGDEFAAIADMVYAMNDEALQRRVDSGRVSPEEAETLRRTLVDYVPLRTDMENDERDAHNTYSSGWHQSEFRTAHGRRTLADSPLAWSIVQAERSIRDANANRVRQTAAALVRKSAAMGKPIGEIIPGTQVRRRWAFNIGGEVLTLEELRDRTDLIFFKEDGKLKVIRMNVGANSLGNTFAKAVTDKDLVKFSKWFEWIPRLTSAMSAMRTQYVPTFIIRNLKADHFEVLLNVGSERGIVGGAKFFGRLVANEWRNRRDVRDYFRDGELRGRMKEFVENGGLTGGGMAAEGFSEAARRVDHTLRTTRGGVARKVAAAIPDAISLLNACAEFNTRVGVFSALRDEGVGVEDAVSYARDATVNFNRRGSLTPYLNAAFMFSNAAIQGLGRAFKSMRSEHGKRMVTLLFLVGFLQSLLDHFLGRDEDREKEGLSSARNLSEHEKQSTVGIPLPGGLRLKTQIRNPWALPMYAGRKAGELLMGWIDGRTAIADLASAVGGFVTEPVGGNGFGSVPEAMQTFAPTLLDPFVQWATGVDFKGDRRLRKNYSDHLPDSWNGRINTPDVYKWISQGANAISGGSRFRKGAFDTSPENWQLLAETVLGGALADLNRAFSTVKDARLAALGAKPEQVLRDVPFVRDTLTNLPDVSSRYYDALSDYEADRTEYSGLARTDAGKAEAFATSHPWAVGSENPVVGIVWKLGRAVQEAETPSDAAKLRREQLAAMAGFVRRMEEARKPGERKVNR